MAKILLVQNNVISRGLIARRLERRGFHVICSSVSQGVVAKARSECPDVILVDLNATPAQDLHLARRLKASPEIRAIPVVGLTAQIPPTTGPDGVCDAYAARSVGLDGLIRTITDVLERSQVPGQGVEGPASTDREPAILVVDHNPLSREMLSRLLQREGFQASCAVSGPEAIDRLGREAFDLVLLDLAMPEMSGLEVLAIIRSRHEPGELPVIAVLPRDQVAEAEAVLRSGANDYVTRPFHFPVLLTRLRAQVRMHQEERAERQEAKEGGPSVVPPSACHLRPVGEGERLRPRTVPRSSMFTVEPFSETGSTTGDSLVQLRTPTTRPEVGLNETDAPGSTDTWPAEDLSRAGYEVLEELGRGGMGVVYKARHRWMNRFVALKVINQEHLARPRTIQRFYREVQAAAQFAHRNIVMAFDAGEIGQTHYFAMEFVPGLDLKQLIEKHGPPPVAVACDFISQAARGLQHAHERGLVHRDVKPSNLRITWDRPEPPEGGWYPGSELRLQDAVVKILDLGLALLNEEGEVTGPVEGRAVGTADYMAPEQWVNAHQVDVRADLYSLGATFYHLLTGEVPFPACEPMEKMLKHHLDEPTPVEQLRPGVPAEVAAVVRRLMAKQPGQRYQLAGEVERALARVRRPGSV